MIFDIAISVGMNCQCRYNISRTLYIRTNGNVDGFFIGRNKKNVLDYGSFFFDWSVTPIRSTISIIKNNFEKVLELDNLQINTPQKGKQTIYDRATGCKYPHMLPQTQQGNCTPDLLRESYSQIKEKYDYIVKKTKNALCSDKNLLFVLTGNHSDENILELCNAIDLYSENYKLLFTPWFNKPNYVEYSVLKKDERIIIRPIKHEPYPGNFLSWDKAFEGITLNTPRSDKINNRKRK